MEDPFSVGKGCTQSKRSISTRGVSSSFGVKSVYYVCGSGRKHTEKIGLLRNGCVSRHHSAQNIFYTVDIYKTLPVIEVQSTGLWQSMCGILKEELRFQPNWTIIFS